MCSQHCDLQGLGVLEVIDEQEDRSIKLDNWPCLCHVKGFPGRKNLLETAIIRNRGRAEEIADPKDGLEESTPSLPSLCTAGCW